MPTYASFTGALHAHSLTPGKRYLVEDCATYFTIRDDADLPRFCQWSGCPHLCGGNWTRHDEPDVKEPEPPQMQIEEGKFYRTRDGRKVGPMAVTSMGDNYSPEWKWKGSGYIYRDDGSEHLLRREISGADLVAEWSDTPGERQAISVRPEAVNLIQPQTPDTLPLLGDMTDAEIGALVRAWHNGQKIEYWHTHHLEWTSCEEQPIWAMRLAYRVKPEPVQKTVKVIIRHEDGDTELGSGTIDLIDDVFQPDTFKLDTFKLL